MITAEEALERLRSGNRRFADEMNGGQGASSQRKIGALTAAQNPFAIILGCADSRVPAELVFDQGLGDLFVIRVAGNIVAPSQVGSVEFAAERFDARLVVVLGHSDCGAVKATLEELRRPSDHRSPNLRSIVDRIRPAVIPLLEDAADTGDLTDRAVRANIRASVDQLRHGSQILEQQIRREELLVVGAEYSLDTGLVDFFDHVSGDSGG